MLDKQIYRLNASVIYSMLLYPLCVTVRKVSIFDFVGKAVLVVMLFSLLILFCIKRQDKSSWLILALTAAMHIFEFAYPVSQKETFTTYLMYAVWVIFFYISKTTTVPFLMRRINSKLLLIQLLLFGRLLLSSRPFSHLLTNIHGERVLTSSHFPILRLNWHLQPL